MANNTRKKNTREQAERSFTNIDSSSASTTLRKMSLSALATVLTAATCLGGQPILASSNILLPPTTAAFAAEVHKNDPTPWLHKPNILEFQRYRFANSNGTTGSTDGLGDYDNTTKKSDMYAHLEKDGNDKYLIFDVFFNNDGKSMLTHSNQHQYVWQIPFTVADLNSNGGYKNDTISELSFDFYQRNDVSPQTANAMLSRDIKLFRKDDKKSFSVNVGNNGKDNFGSTYLNTLGIRGGRSYNRDLNETFHNNAKSSGKVDPVIEKAVKLYGPYSGKSYGIGLRTTNANYAVHMHCKLKLRQDATIDDIQNAFTWANSSSYGKTTNSAYTFISGRTHDENFPRTKSDNLPPKLYFNGKELTDNSSSITVYQGDKQKITFGTSDNSEKVTKFSVSGLSDFVKNGKVDEKNDNGIDASESKPYTKVFEDVKFEHKDEKNNPVNSDYTITVSATDASGNTAEKKVTVHLKNLNQKYPSPTAEELTVDWGHELNKDELTKQIKNNAEKGEITFIDKKLPKTKLSESAFKRSKNKLKVTAKITYADGSSHTVDIPVTVRKPLAFEHAPQGSKNTVTVGDKLKQPSDYITLKNNTGNKVKPEKVEWYGGTPNSSTIGTFDKTVRVNYKDGSRKDTTVTFNVKPKTPVIETDLNGRAKIQNQKVVVNVGTGFIPKATNTVTLYDANNNEIGSTTEINDGKATITVANGIPAGNVYAVTSSSYNDTQDKHTNTFNLSSDKSKNHQATEDKQDPTLTANDATAKVGENLSFELEATDDIKIDDFNIAAPLVKLVNGDFSRLKIEYQGAQDDPKHRKVKITILGMKASEVGEHKLTFSVTDAAGNTTKKEVKLTVKQPYELKANPITVELGHELTNDDAKKIFENSKNVPSGTTYTWVTKPKTDSTDKEKPGTVRVSIPGEKPQDINVAVTVQDTVKPVIKVYKKGPGGTWTSVTEKITEGDTSYTKIDTYHGDKCELKITATDNSGKVTDLKINSLLTGLSSSDFESKKGAGSEQDPRAIKIAGNVPNGTAAGAYSRTLVAVDGSGNQTNFPIRFIVHNQADKFGKITPKDITHNIPEDGNNNNHPKAEDGISEASKKDLPTGTTYSWVKEPDWNKPGKDTTATIRITFPDGSHVDVSPKLTITDTIKPVIEKPDLGTAKHGSKDHYLLKVHRGEKFDLTLKVHDNTGKIVGASLNDNVTDCGITKTNLTVDNASNHSVKNPAIVHITGTAPTDEVVDQHWSRTVTVTDEAGNKSELPIQIAVYTSAEEHKATSKQVKKPFNSAVTVKDIQDAITTDYTSKDPNKKPVVSVKAGQTLPDGTTSGNSKVTAIVTYPDGSTTEVVVPVTIATALSRTHIPKSNTVEKSYGSTKKQIEDSITSTSTGGGISWPTGKVPTGNTTIEISDKTKIPSGTEPGTYEVPVKITYSDNSIGYATVNVKIGDPQSKSYNPQGNTLTFKYNSKPKTDNISGKITGVGEDKGISFGKNKQGNDIALPDRAKVAIDNPSNIPDGTKAGDFNIPVTITYKDGSEDHTVVKVKIGEPQSETNKPTVTDITKKYGEKSNEDEVNNHVTFDSSKPKPTVTVENANDIPNGTTPGDVNINVNIEYPDGSKSRVTVKVTTGDPDTKTYAPSANEVKKNRRDKITAADITGAVKTSTVKDKPAPTETKVELVNENNLPDMTKTGTTNVPVKVTYPDGSEVVLEVPVVVRDTDKDIYTPTSSTLEKPYGSTISEKDITDKVKVPNFVGDETKISYTVKDKNNIPGKDSKPGVYTVPVTVTYPDKTSEDVDVNVTILNKDSDSYEPTATTLTKKHGEKISNDDITNQVNVPNYPTGKKQPTKTVETGKKLPDTNTPGESDVPVTVTYQDGTSDTVNVHVVVKDTDANTHTPQAEPLEKNIDRGKPEESEITSQVTIPTWPANEKDKPTYSIADSDKAQIPNGDKAGKFEVPVTVTYPDGSTTVINVPVIIKAPKPEAKTGVTVPKGSEPKPEDMISNKDKFPDDTQFEWKKENGNETGKPDTKTAGNTQGTVVVTVPGQKSQEVTVKVNVVEPSASEVNVPQGTDLPDAKEVIKDSNDTNKYPSETTFTWKPEDKPDTNNPGAKNGKIIVTLPGQSPVEVSVTVNVLPKPEANVVNVPQNGTLPDPKNVIKDSNNTSKFPDGTKFTWKDNGPSTTDSGTQTGTITVTVPGVNDKPGTTVDVEVTVNVTPAPKAKDTSVIQNSDPDPKNSIANNSDFPEGTKFEWSKGQDGKSDKPDTSTIGEKTVNVVVTVPGQKPQTVKVKVNVTASPEGKDVTVLQKKDSDTSDTTPKPEDVIKNHKDLPKDAKTSWKKEPDTSKTGNQPGVVTVQVPGEPDVEVSVNVLVVPNPVGKKVNVPQNGDLPNPKDMIANNGDFPEKTTFTWADNGKPSTSNTGEQTGTVSVAIPGITNPVNVTVTVNVVDKDKPFINDRKAENKPDSKKTTITGKTQPENTVTVKDNSGKTVGTPVKADEKGNFTIEIDKKDPNTKLTLVPSKGNNEGTPVDVTVTAKPNAPTITVPSENEGGKLGDGNVTVTPPTDATVTTVEITVKPNPLNGPEEPVRTIVVKKGKDNKWTIDGNNPTGATVDSDGKVITIPTKNLEDGSTITAVAKNKNNTSDTATNKTGYKTPQIKNEDPSSPKITDSTNDSGKQTITGIVTVPNATVTVTDKDGKQIGTGTAGNDGSFTITINKQKPGAIVTLTPTNGKGDGAKTGDRVELIVGGAIATPKISTPNDGSASVTPDESDTRVNKVVITYTPAEGNTTATITVIAEGDNRVWKIDGNTPEGVTVNPDTGVVTITAGKIKNGSKITAQAKQVTKNTGATTATETSSAEVTGTITTQKHHYDPTPVPEPTPTPAPTVTTPSEGADQGSAIVTPPADVDTLLITFLPEGSSESATPVTITVKKDKNGNWTIDGTTPTGVTVDPKTGKVTIPATAVKGGSEVTAQAKKGDKQSEKVTGTTAGSEKKQPKKPGQEPTPSPIPTDKPLVVTPQNGAEQGSATVTPPADADSMEITYTPENEETSSGIGETEIPSLEELTPGTTNPDSQEPGNNPGSANSGITNPGRITIKIKKNAEGNWQIDGDTPDGVTVDPKTGKVTIPANKVKDNTEITAKSKKGNKPSKTATGTVGNNPIDDLNIDDLIDNAGGNSNEKGKGHGENHGNGNNDGNGNDNTGDAGNNYTGDAGNKGDTLNPESGTHRIKRGDTIDANGANNNRANGDDNGSTGNGAQGTQGSQDSQGTQSGSQGAPSESQAKIDKIRARHSSGKIAKSKLSNTGAAIAAISTIAALAAAVGGAIAVIRKKKRK
ncbi:peptidase [Gardnerella vaginalis]|uniref:Peptidase n=1 Tax=Gardnerella vaginalis TaxID=2702 RepID=A0A3E1J229_GARVA|nr:Rib/alpha-like domain-containing protein [Gardnerella vaginalis]RFD80414.1 peptidase [Gardnerella vaginalis]